MLLVFQGFNYEGYSYFLVAMVLFLTNINSFMHFYIHWLKLIKIALCRNIKNKKTGPSNHRVFSCPVEVFRISIWSLYQFIGMSKDSF
jgi:hypothetical protein